MQLNQILFGPPGTGKTYNTINKALQIINEQDEKELDWNDRKKVKKLFDKRLKEGQIVFTTFHQSMSYEDFIEGIKPVLGTTDSAIQYEITPGIFKKICLNAQTKNNASFEVVYQKLIEDLNKLPEGDYIKLNTITGRTFGINLNSRDNLNLLTGSDFRKSGALTKDGIKRELMANPTINGG